MRKATGSQRPAPRVSPPQTAFNLDLEAIARALDPATAAAIWQRLRSGQRGVMVRSIYGNEGRAVFDDISHRCRNDGELSRTVSRYLADFERIVSESDARDPSRPPVARPARLRHRPRLPVPRPRFRPPRLTSAMAAPGEAQLVEAKAEAWPLAKPFVIARGAKTEAHVVVAHVAGGGHSGPRRGRPLCALRRNRRRRGQGPATACSGPLSRARGCPSCCRPAPRATHSTARCGTSKPSRPASAPGISPGWRRRSPR